MTWRGARSCTCRIGPTDLGSEGHPESRDRGAPGGRGLSCGPARRKCVLDGRYGSQGGRLKPFIWICGWGQGSWKNRFWGNLVRFTGDVHDRDCRLHSIGSRRSDGQARRRESANWGRLRMGRNDMLRVGRVPFRVDCGCEGAGRQGVHDASPRSAWTSSATRSRRTRTAVDSSQWSTR